MRISIPYIERHYVPTGISHFRSFVLVIKISAILILAHHSLPAVCLEDLPAIRVAGGDLGGVPKRRRASLKKPWLLNHYISMYAYTNILLQNPLRNLRLKKLKTKDSTLKTR